MKTLERKYLLPFLLVGSLFLMWGMANSMNDTLIAAFKRIMSMSDAQTSLIQCAFFGSYFCFALPAAFFIRSFSYKAGILLGLGLYAAGAMLFYPASMAVSYPFFLFALYVLASGCSILETTANPYILSMGAPETATRRLNMAQMLNPVGSITGILVAQYFILGNLSSADAAERAMMDTVDLQATQSAELSAITGTYLGIGAVLMLIFVAIALIPVPDNGSAKSNPTATSTRSSFRRLLADRRYVTGVLAQFAYVGAQTGVWSFTIRLVMQEFGCNEKVAANLFLASMLLFCGARFLFTWMMKYVRPIKLMAAAAAINVLLSCAVIFGEGNGTITVICLVAISFFMSLMFPTIYGTALENISGGANPEDATLGASGLVMAILGGAVLTPLQGLLSDATSVYISYTVPAVCFVVVLAYALFSGSKSK